MNKISISALLGAVLFAMAGCQAVRLVNTLDYPVTITYQKTASLQHEPEFESQRSYQLAGKETKNLTLEDGPGLYTLSVNAEGNTKSYTNVPLLEITQLKATQPEGSLEPKLVASVGPTMRTTVSTQLPQ